jgi:hypothetical protein
MVNGQRFVHAHGRGHRHCQRGARRSTELGGMGLPTGEEKARAGKSVVCLSWAVAQSGRGDSGLREMYPSVVSESSGW